jgi:hypothetical protein
MDKGNNMQTKYVHRLITKLLSIILLLTVPNSLQPTSASSSVLYSPTPLPAEIQESFTLYGRVTDQTANPVQTNIYVTDLNNNTLANLLTNENGDYSIAFPERVNLVVNAFPQGLPQNLITLPDGYQISKYFELTKGVMPASASEEVNFVIPPAAVLRLAAYDPASKSSAQSHRILWLQRCVRRFSNQYHASPGALGTQHRYVPLGFIPR